VVLSQNVKLSGIIKDMPWFYQSWKLDPTINGMLTMLDDIHGRFYGGADYYERLVRSENPVITFLFLNLNEFKLTDDLYIKMNARGKPLTDFENFKAKFEQAIGTLDFDEHKPDLKISSKDVSVREYFSQRIDTTWTDLFWPYRDNRTYLFDDQLMNFLRATATFHLATDSDDVGKYDSITTLREANKVSFGKYQDMGCITANYVLFLMNLLDRLTKNNGGLQIYLTDSFYYDEKWMFEQSIGRILRYDESLKLYAFARFLINGNRQHPSWTNDTNPSEACCSI